MKQFLMVFGLLVLLVLPASAQQIYTYHVPDNGEVQEFSGSFSSSDDIAELTLLSMDIGQTIYVFVQAGGDMDPLIAVFNAQDFNTPVAVDDNGGGGKNPLLQFAMPARGDYIVAIF